MAAWGLSACDLLIAAARSWLQGEIGSLPINALRFSEVAYERLISNYCLLIGSTHTY